MRDEAELRRRINENLAAIRSGRRAREVEEEKRKAAEARERRKANERRAKAISRQLKELDAERAGLEEYLNELLLREGCELIEECDAALKGCEREIYDLTEELKDLLV